MCKIVTGDALIRDSLIAALFDQSDDSVLIADKTLKVCAANSVALVQFEGVLNQSLNAVLTADTCADLNEMYGIADLQNCIIQIEIINGSSLIAAVAKVNDLLVIRILSQEIQRLRQSENAERLMFLGRIAAQLAHAMSNPLAVIQGRQELILARYGANDSSLERQLTILQKQCLRIGQLLQSLQVVAKSKLSRTLDIQLHAIVDEVVSGIIDKNKGQKCYNHIPDDFVLHCDPTIFKVAFQNLMVRLTELSVGHKSISLQFQDTSLHHILDIALDGAALGNDLIEGMTKLSMTGKIPEQSIGYAFSIATVLFKEMNTTMIWDEQPDAGSLVRIVFPKTRGVRDFGQPKSVKQPLRIMVIDDHRILREMLTSLLSHDGHDIIGVSSAEDALLILNEQTVDVILVDIRLPGMTGDEFVDYLDGAFPELINKVVLISGEDYTAPVGSLFLRKPFTKQQLVNMINLLLTKQLVQSK